MATSPYYQFLSTFTVSRDVSDYLWAMDPSGQFYYGYSWDHCGNRPVNIYDVHGSGQCLNAQGIPIGEFKLFAKEFVQTARAPTLRGPLRITGPGYDIFGAGFGLVPSSGHTVFKDNTPVIDWNHPYPMSGWKSAPVDLRYDLIRGVWSSPYNTFLAEIIAVADVGFAYGPSNEGLKSTLPVRNYYSVESGLYRYRARPYILPTGEIDRGFGLGQDYPAFSLINVAEFNGDFAYLDPNVPINVIKNPSPLASGSYLCNERPVSWAAFV